MPVIIITIIVMTSILITMRIAIIVIISIVIIMIIIMILLLGLPPFMETQLETAAISENGLWEDGPKLAPVRMQKLEGYLCGPEN